MPGQSVVVPRFPSLSLIVFGSALLIAVSQTGCSPAPDLPDSGLRELRLVDRSSRALMQFDLGGKHTEASISADDAISTNDYPVATINDDSRYVLAAPSFNWLLVQTGTEVPANGRLALSPGYPPNIPAADHLLVAPRAKIDGAWQDLPDVVVPTKSKGSTRYVPFELQLGESHAGKKVDLHIDAFALSWGSRQTYESANLAVGEGNRLDFSIGILEAAWNCGPVQFVVEWCDDDGCSEVFNEVGDPSTPVWQRWQNRSVPLEGLSGRRGRLVFKNSRVGENAEPFTFPVWANPTVVRPAKPAGGAYNVVLLSIDTQRADHLTSYGYEHDTAPFIDAEFARKGAVFENPVAGASSTSPSHMTMFTGMQASAHGLTQGLEGLAPWISTFTEAIRAAGYETGAVTENGWLGKHHGFGRGFNVYVENRSANIMAPTGQVDVTFARARDWIELNQDRRFFLFLHTFQVHDPFSPPAAYQTMFRSRDGEPIDENSPWYAQWRMAYDQEIRYTDDELRILWQKFEELGLADNTIFILTSDHGENFMEHGYFGHGAHLHEPVVRVPLIVRGPGVAASMRHRDPVGHVDLAPTILDFMGIDPAVLPQIQGRSLVNLLSGGEDYSESESVYFTESWSPMTRSGPKNFVRFESPAFSARSGSLKLARYLVEGEVTYEAFDLAEDPGEERNLWPADRERFAELHELLENYEDGMHAYRARLREGVEGEGGNDPQHVELDPEQEEKLRALGYLN